MQLGATRSSRPRRFKGAWGINAVKVNVVQGGAGSAVFVDEGEGGAGHILGESGFESFRDPLHQRRLSRPQVAAQQHDERGRQFGGKAPAVSDRLLGGVSRVMVWLSSRRVQYSEGRQDSGVRSHKTSADSAFRET